MGRAFGQNHGFYNVKFLQVKVPEFSINDLDVDLMTRQVMRAEKQIPLTAKEFALLEYLIRNTNRVVSKNQILENVWNMDFDPESNIVEVYMHQLRRKIDKGFDNPAH